jgi:hypothetical protein
MVAYEGSPNILVAGASDPPPGVSPNYFTRQNATKRHPRMYGAMLQVIQLYQNAGLTLWNFFNLGGLSSGYAWDAFEYYDQPLGTGNPTLDPINISNPQAKNQVKAEYAGAWYYWSTLNASTTSTTGTKKTTPGRNGMIRAIGFPRGMFRPTR